MTKIRKVATNGANIYPLTIPQGVIDPYSGESVTERAFDRPYDSENPNGMGYVVLRKDLPFAEQVTAANTIYEIRYDFDLSSDFTMPSNCVLKFNGGSIFGAYTLTGDNTEIVFGSGKINCTLSGSFTNNVIYIEWFGLKSGSGFASLNDSIFTQYISPSYEGSMKNTFGMFSSSTLYFSSPLSFSAKNNIDFLGEVRYDGAYNTTAISIGDSSTLTQDKTFRINSLVSMNRDHAEQETTPNYVGVHFINVKNCNIELNHIESFAYNIKFSALGRSCSSNIIRIVNTCGWYKIGVWLYSDNDGWINENLFIFGNISSSVANPYKLRNDSIGFYILAERMSANGNCLLKPNVEANPTPFKFSNDRNNVVLSARYETSTIPFVNENGASNNIILSSYSYQTPDGFGELNNLSLPTSQLAFRSLPMLKGGPITYVGDVITNFVSVYTNGFINPFGNPNHKKVAVGIVVDVTSAENVIKAYSKTAAKFVVGIFGENNKLIQPTGTISDYVSKGTLFADPNCNYFLVYHTNINDLTLSFNYTNVKRVFIGAYWEYVVDSNVVETKDLIFHGRDVCVRDEYSIDPSIKSIEIKEKSDLVLAAANTEIGYTIKLSGDILIHTTSHTLTSDTSIIFNGGKISGGNVKLNGAKIYPNYNTLLDRVASTEQMPAEGTMYWQSGRPTWSNGTNWVDAAGTPV